MNKQQFRNILVVRTDRIGDVILSLPMISALKTGFPTARVSMLLRSYTKELAEGQHGLSAIVLYDNHGVPKPFFRMLRELRLAKYDAAVVAYPRFRIALLLYVAGIRTRVASGYRWYSYLFNTRVYEHRKTAEKHESEYNLSLLRAMGCEVPQTVTPSLAISKREKNLAKIVRKDLGLSDRDRVVVLHPGSGGSAQDWKPENFSQLASEFVKKSFKVVVTGGPGEGGLVRRVVSGAGPGVLHLVGRLNLKELGAFIQTAQLFISNSTGPLHIAAAVGIPVIGFYPPIRVASPQRWGPLTNKRVIFVPERTKCSLCKGGECQSNVCMDQIHVTDVMRAAVELLKSSSKKRKT